MSPDSHQNHASGIYRIYEQEVSSQSGFPRLLASFENEGKDADLVTIHDLLSLLAEQMITLNDRKHQCAKELIDWLETKPDNTLQGRRQRGQCVIREGLVKELYWRLSARRTPCSIPRPFRHFSSRTRRIIRSKLDAKFEGTFREKYEDVMSRALPIKGRLTATDHLYRRSSLQRI